MKIIQSSQFLHTLQHIRLLSVPLTEVVLLKNILNIGIVLGSVCVLARCVCMYTYKCACICVHACVCYM